jgi:hypothetical protein
MTFRFVDPTVESDLGAHRIAPRLADLEGLRIGLLGNRKLNAAELLAETAALFEQRHGCRVLPLAEKAHAGKPCPPELLRSIAERVDFLVTANGD